MAWSCLLSTGFLLQTDISDSAARFRHFPALAWSCLLSRGFLPQTDISGPGRLHGQIPPFPGPGPELPSQCRLLTTNGHSIPLQCVLVSGRCALSPLLDSAQKLAVLFSNGCENSIVLESRAIPESGPDHPQSQISFQTRDETQCYDFFQEMFRLITFALCLRARPNVLT